VVCLLRCESHLTPERALALVAKVSSSRMNPGDSTPFLSTVCTNTSSCALPHTTQRANHHPPQHSARVAQGIIESSDQRGMLALWSTCGLS
jgi:hypothetical protein